MSLRYARVVGIHPEANSVDLLFLDNGARAPLVQVMSPFASTNTGLADLAEPSLANPSDKYSPKESKDRDIYALVGTVGGTPVVIGFLFPQVCQMLFEDINRRIDRHASDVYSTIDAAGNFEMFHPSRTYFRIGTDAAHEDLTGKDLDKKWKIGKNTDKEVHVHLEVWNGGAKKATVDIDPSGNVLLDHIGNLTANTGGNLSATIAGTTAVDSTGKVTVTCPAEVLVDTPKTTFTGEVIVQGHLTYQAGMSGSGGSGGATAAITGDVQVTSGDVQVTGGDVTADGKSLKTHVHSGVQPGSGNTGSPV